MTGAMKPQFFEDLFERDSRVIALHSADVEAALANFRLVCRSSGRSMYHWSENLGMVSLKAADINVPGARKLVDALRYVFQSMHYGAYIFTHFEKQMRPAAHNMLARIAEMEEPRTVVLLAERVSLPPRLSERVDHVVDTPNAEAEMQPRLRDGRWVV